MGPDMYSDGGIVAANPSALAIHEARTIFPDVPIEMIVSVGTGEFDSETVKPAFGWDGIVTQIVKSATVRGSRTSPSNTFKIMKLTNIVI